MKKILATLLFLVICFINSTEVYATAYERYSISEVYDASGVDFNYISNFLDEHAKSHVSKTGEKITWAIISLDNRQSLQFAIFYDANTDMYKELVNSVDDSIDFIQFGVVQNSELLDYTEAAFKEDSIKAALNAIMPIGVGNIEKNYEEIKEHKIPIYWSIKESNELGVYTLEVAIGKYVINRGDTLSTIALRNHTTVERLLEKNSNISNPNLIYAGDYLVIK